MLTFAFCLVPALYIHFLLCYSMHSHIMYIIKAEFPEKGALISHIFLFLLSEGEKSLKLWLKSVPLRPSVHVRSIGKQYEGSPLIF